MVTIDNEVNTLVAQKYSAVIEMLMLIRVENGHGRRRACIMLMTPAVAGYQNSSTSAWSFSQRSENKSIEKEHLL